jgi:hypothetical protein
LNRTRQSLRFVGLIICLSSLSDFALSAPLFDGEEVLDVVIEAPIRDLGKQRMQEPEFAGMFRYTDASGTELALPIKITTRGHSRLEICDYPPLKITFNPDETIGTLFEGQSSLKLVTQCIEGSNGAAWLHLEHGIYRAYNQITDYSYKTRKLNVTYRETKSRGRDRLQPAFILEADKQLAKRLGRQRIRPPKVDSVQMSKMESTRNLLFQFLIGNTDLAMKRGQQGEGCCHNGRVYAKPGTQEDWVIVPYDFDYAGIVNTEYALPYRKLPIRRVTTRLYRGFCWQNELLPEVIERFNQKRGEIESALTPAELSKTKARGAKRYVDKFYDIVNDPKDLQKQIIDDCRGPDSLPLRESPVAHGE